LGVSPPPLEEEEEEEEVESEAMAGTGMILSTCEKKSEPAA